MGETMKKNIVEIIFVLIVMVTIAPFTNGEMAKSLKWVDHEPNPRFAIYDPGTPADEGDDLVLDKENGLIWTRNANLVGSPLTWEEAINHCKALELCNLKGWRIPTKEELSSLIDPSQSVPALPKGNPFVNIKYTYWTSSTYEDFSDDAYFVHFGQGAVRAYTKQAKYEVWPVMGK
jgi:hypothetical protein